MNNLLFYLSLNFKFPIYLEPGVDLYMLDQPFDLLNLVRWLEKSDLEKSSPKWDCEFHGDIHPMGSNP